jgi:hypothetical protein
MDTKHFPSPLAGDGKVVSTRNRGEGVAPQFFLFLDLSLLFRSTTLFNSS